jgi:hypothetical protein
VRALDFAASWRPVPETALVPRPIGEDTRRAENAGDTLWLWSRKNAIGGKSSGPSPGSCCCWLIISLLLVLPVAFDRSSSAVLDPLT